jgi:hypothetical protein
MDTATDTRIPYPKIITPVEVEVVDQVEYLDSKWSDVVKTIEDAEAEVVKAQRVKREANAAYEMAVAQRAAVQVPRDQMIATDSRTPAQIGRLAGIGRSRCSQLRVTIRTRMGLPTIRETTFVWCGSKERGE